MRQKLRVLLAIPQSPMRVWLKAQVAVIAPEIELVEATNFLQVQQSRYDVAIIHMILLPEQIVVIQKPFFMLTEQPTLKELLLLRENMQCFGYASLHPALEPLLSYFQTTNFRQRNTFWLDPHITLSLIQHDNINYFEFNGWEKLTARERAIFDLLKQRKTTNEIAEVLGIAACTVRTHKQHIWRKLGIDVNELKNVLTKNHFRES